MLGKVGSAVSPTQSHEFVNTAQRLTCFSRSKVFKSWSMLRMILGGVKVGVRLPSHWVVCGNWNPNHQMLALHLLDPATTKYRWANIATLLGKISYTKQTNFTVLQYWHAINSPMNRNMHNIHKAWRINDWRQRQFVESFKCVTQHRSVMWLLVAR